MKTADILKGKYSVFVISMPTIKPLDTNLVIKLAKQMRAIFTMEEHSIIGGLGTAVSEVLAEEGLISVIFKRFGTPDRFNKVSGDQNYMRRANGLGEDQIAFEIEKSMME